MGRAKKEGSEVLKVWVGIPRDNVNFWVEFIRGLIIDSMSGARGTMVYFLPWKVTDYFNKLVIAGRIEKVKKLSPYHYLKVYRILKCIAEKSGGLVIESGCLNTNCMRIGIPTTILNMDLDNLIRGCVYDVIILKKDYGILRV